MTFEFTVLRANVSYNIYASTDVDFTYAIDGGDVQGSSTVFIRGSLGERVRNIPPYVTRERLEKALTRWAKKKVVNLSVIDPTLVGQKITITVSR